jgi:hypothetical protein
MALSPRGNASFCDYSFAQAPRFFCVDRIGVGGLGMHGDNSELWPPVIMTRIP